MAQKLKQKYKVKERSGKQCRERWHNHLSPKVNKDLWTPQEEVELFSLQRIYGNKWSVIAKHLPGRTDNSIKNHFYSTLRRNIRAYNRFHSTEEQISLPLKALLRNSELASIVLTPSCSFNPSVKSTQEYELSQILFRIYDEARERCLVIKPTPSYREPFCA